MVRCRVVALYFISWFINVNSDDSAESAVAVKLIEVSCELLLNQD